MKLTNFRVRDLLQQKNISEALHKDNEEHNHQENTSSNQESKLFSVLQSLENIIASYLHSNISKPTQNQSIRLDSDPTRDFEPRDRFVTLNLPDLPEQQNE
jgi:hypothetical protein